MSRRAVALPFAGLFIAMGLTTACGSTTETIVNTTAPSSSRCQPALGSTSASYAAAGGAGTLTVTVERECEWNANPSASWIAVTAGKQGQGDGTITYRVTENVDPLSRRGSIDVSGQTAQIAQEAAPCRFTVAPAQLTAPSSGGDLHIDVRTHAVCSWTASPGASWTTLSPPAGKGDGSVQARVVANTGAERSADLTVAGQRVLLSQEAVAQTPPAPPPPSPTPDPPGPLPPGPLPPPPQCSYALSAGSASFDDGGGTGAVRVRTTAACPWTVSSSALWVSVTSPATGAGDGEIRYVVAPNFATTGRAATLTVQSEVFRITQDRAEELKLDGKISSFSGVCPNLRFRVDNRTVTTDRNTEFRRGDCSKARNGENVTIRGFAQPDGTVLATRVEF